MDELRELRQRVFELETTNARLEHALEEGIELAEQGRPLGIVVRRLRAGAANFRRQWTPESIVAKAQEWAEQYGRPPSALDWNPAMARRSKLEDKIERYYEGDWPPYGTVTRHFPRWNAMIAAAGFDPREPGANEATGGGAREGEEKFDRLPVWTGWQLIRPLRDRLGLTQHALASNAGLSENYVTAVERGAQTNPSIRVLLALSAALGVGPRALIEVETDPE